MSAWPAGVVVLVALLSAWAMSAKFGAPETSNRTASLDGLRGYLAIGVVIHHGATWYYFLRSDRWDIPPSNLYVNCGQTSVVLFFMITGFLFFTKLLEGRERPINWPKLYVSRGLRLYPMYAVALVILVFTVGVLSGFVLKVSVGTLAGGILKWVLFTVPGGPDLNGVDRSFMISAGVMWTLRYEWLFYCALPLLGLLVGASASRGYLLASALAVSGIVYAIHPLVIHLEAFLGGIAAAVLVRTGVTPRFVKEWPGAMVAIGAWAAAMVFFPTAFRRMPVLLLTVTFVVIAAGNTLFGVLEWRASRFLGQLTYGIYVIHGALLFWTFRFLVGLDRARSLSLMAHWTIVCVIIPILVATCYLTFRWVELPGMQSVKPVYAWFGTKIQRLRSADGGESG